MLPHDVWNKQTGQIYLFNLLFEPLEHAENDRMFPQTHTGYLQKGFFFFEMCCSVKPLFMRICIVLPTMYS